jgi:hypothetical protein
VLCAGAEGEAIELDEDCVVLSGVTGPAVACPYAGKAAAASASSNCKLVSRRKPGITWALLIKLWMKNTPPKTQLIP